MAFSLTYADWQLVHFTPLERADLLISDPDADPDADGFSNFFEFALGSGPKTDEHGTNAPVIAGDPSTGPASHAGIEFSRPKPLVGALDWQLEFSESLLPGSWQIIAGATEEVLGEASMVQTVRLEDPAPFSAQRRRFYRLKISELP